MAQPRSSLVRVFSQNAESAKLLQAPSNDTAQFPKRPPPEQRQRDDLSGDALTAYINGLETRLIDHMRRHAPRWHDRETRKILNRWNALQAQHPAPGWAAARDTATAARDYAAALVRDRLTIRMHRLGDIRIARYLGGHQQVDPLHLIFHGRSIQLEATKPRKITKNLE